MKRIFFLTLAAALFFSSSALAWDGYNLNTGAEVEIGKGNLVRRGSTIDVYDYNSGEYKSVDVEAIRRTPLGTVEVDVYDYNTGESSTLEMDGRQ